MAKIEIGRFSQLMRRFLSMSGVVEVAQELSPEISPAFILEAERPEWEFIKNQKLCTSQISVTAAAGLQSTARLRNPAASGVLATIHSFNFSVVNTAILLVYRLETGADLANIVATVTRDTRWPSLNVSALIASQDNVVATGDFFYHTFALAGQANKIDLPFVLAPGFAVQMNVEDLNRDLRGNFHWIERPIGALEVAT